MHPLYTKALSWSGKGVRTARIFGGVPLPSKNAAKLSWFYTKVAKERKEAMHPLYPKAHALSCKVIGAAIEVHRLKGPGLIESIYEKCMMRELALQNIPAFQQIPVPIDYKGLQFDELLRLDVFVDDCLVVEIKAVEKILPIHKAQLLSYMKLLNVPLGLLINFHEVFLRNGITRLILEGADQP